MSTLDLLTDRGSVVLLAFAVKQNSLQKIRNIRTNILRVGFLNVYSEQFNGDEGFATASKNINKSSTGNSDW